MRKINFDTFYGLNYINYKEKLNVLKMLNNKSLFRYDGVKMCYESDKLESKLKNFFNQDILLVNNGTSALKLALIACNIGYKDEVLVPAVSFIASAASILSVGATPIFVNVDETFNIDPNDIENKITKNTKAILIVHYQGYPCDMDKIVKIAKKHNLKIIEDVAQAFGAKYKDKLLGTFGNAAAFSFQACKIITCGEGGAFTAKSNFASGKRYADNGGERPYDSYPRWDLDYTTFGENFKITDMQSAILSKQFLKLDKIIAKQKRSYDYIVINIFNYKIRPIPENSNLINMSLCLIFESKDKCDNFIKYTNELGLPFDTKIGNFLPNYNTFKNAKSYQSSNFPYDNYKVNACSYTLDLVNRSAWLTLNSTLSKKDLKYIVRVLGDYNAK